MKRTDVLCIIQARETSTRFPKKVYAQLKGRSLISLVCEAARNAHLVDKVVVAWAHKFPHLDENDVLSRFQEVVAKYQPRVVVRITSDCPLINSWYIDYAISMFFIHGQPYYYNGIDGFDVQVFTPGILYTGMAHREHIIQPYKYSVDTPAELNELNNMDFNRE
jgi:spore coat polysaccharide biosynthesis protein SpsF (cytidylyltransferase family)